MVVLWHLIKSIYQDSDKKIDDSLNILKNHDKNMDVELVL